MQLQGFCFSTSSTHVVHKLNTILTFNPFAFFFLLKVSCFCFLFFPCACDDKHMGFRFLVMSRVQGFGCVMVKGEFHVVNVV
jgi:hypothetical protein